MTYEQISCGVDVRCLSATTGEVLWTGAVSGVQVGHSEYFHNARLKLLPRAVVILGIASGGDYAEGFSPATGQALAKWTVLK